MSNPQRDAIIAQRERQKQEWEEKDRQAKAKTAYLLNCEECGVTWMECQCLKGMGRHITINQDDSGYVMRVYTLESTVMIDRYTPNGEYTTLVLGDQVYDQMMQDWLGHQLPDYHEMVPKHIDHLPYAEIIDDVIRDANAIGDGNLDEWVASQQVEWITQGHDEKWIMMRTHVAQSAYKMLVSIRAEGYDEDHQRLYLSRFFTDPSVPTLSTILEPMYQTIIRQRTFLAKDTVK